jgi:hypothetical protein
MRERGAGDVDGHGPAGGEEQAAVHAPEHGLDPHRDLGPVRAFDEDGAYSKSDVDSVRKQLGSPGWSQLVQVHRNAPQEDVDVYVNMEGDQVKGLAVIASEPREFTIVNIVGSIDVDKIGRLEGQFGIPQLSQNQ